VRHGNALFWGPTGIAFAIRVAHVLTLPGNPLFMRPIMDAAVHDAWARGLVAGTWPAAEPFFRAPGYPLVLGLLYWVLGRVIGLDLDATPARVCVALVQAAVSAAGAGLVALIAGRAWGRRAGWCAGLIYATLWTSVYFVGELLLETLATTLALWWLWRLLGDDGEGDAPPAARTLLGVGLLAGLGAITRPPLLALVPVAAWYLWRHRGLSARAPAWLALVIGLLLPILPVTLHNAIRGRDAVLIATQGGINFWIGNNPQADGRTAIAPDTRPTWQGGYDDAIAAATREAGRALRPSEIDAHYLRKGLSYLAADPGGAIALYGRKTRLLFAAGERSNNNNPYFWRQRSIVLRWPIWLGFAPVLLLATLGYWRRDLHPARRFLLLGAATMYAFSVLLFFVNGRFRLPLLAMLAIPAGAGLDRLWQAVRARRWPDPWVAPVAALALFAFSTADLLTFRENRTEADAFSRFTLGNALADAGDLDGARRAWEDALAAQRRFRLTQFGLIEEPLYTSLGRLYAERGETEQAVRLYTDWVRANPATIAGRVALGDLLLQVGRTDEAGAQFEMALRAAPDHAGAQLGQAWILRANGEPGPALRRFRALAGDPGLGVGARFGEGLCLIDLGRWAEAEQAFADVLRQQPEYWQAWGNLAGVYERMGKTAEARRAYERLLALRPGDPNARRYLEGPPR